jgi:perosamine synthetase
MNRLQPRLRLDVTGRDVLAGCAHIATSHSAHRSHITDGFSASGDALVALSVRSAFDALLAEVRWPTGSEVLITGLTIPDMPRIITHHGYVPLPVDVSLDTLVPSMQALRAAVTPRTVAWLHAHLFGTRTDLRPATAMLERLGIVVIEDCAQAYTGQDFSGSPGVAASLFSFGTIKTATATGGAVMRVHDPDLRDRIGARMRCWPQERPPTRLRKIVKTGALLMLGRPRVYSRLIAQLRSIGKDPDVWVHASARGFPHDDFFTAIRHQPSPALLALLDRRLHQDTVTRIAARREVGELLRACLPAGVRLLGGACPVRTHWVFPVVSADPDRLRATLVEAGFDATSRSSLAAVTGPDGTTPANCTKALAGIVYIPLPPRDDPDTIGRLALALTHYCNGEAHSSHPAAA